VGGAHPREHHPVVDMVGRENIAAQIGARYSGDVQPIHQLLTHEIDIESETKAKAVWAMADLIFRGESAVPEQKPGEALPPFRTMRGWGH
jgi:hypothetical protein